MGSQLRSDTSSPRLLITGGSGFIGTNAVEYFSRRGYSVLNLDIKPPVNPMHRALWRQCDIRNKAEIGREVCAFAPDYVLHLAARTDLAERSDLCGYSANIEGVENMLAAIESAGSVRRAIFASSRMVCRIGYRPTSDTDYCPPNLYGESKVIGERMVRAAGLGCDWTLVRPTSIWGPWFDVPYKIFFTTIARGLYFHPGGCDPVKSFGFVGNTVFQLHRLLDAPRERVRGKTFYVCDYPPLRLRKWAEMIRVAMRRGPIPVVPLPALKLAARCGDVLERAGWYRVPLTRFRLDNLVTDMEYETSELADLCGELPYGLEEGVAETVAWMRSAGEIPRR